jgi:hypothetical protein
MDLTTALGLSLLLVVIECVLLLLTGPKVIRIIANTLTLAIAGRWLGSASGLPGYMRPVDNERCSLSQEGAAQRDLGGVWRRLQQSRPPSMAPLPRADSLVPLP